MSKKISKLENPNEHFTYNSKEQWIINCLAKSGIDVEGIIQRRLEKLDKSVDSSDYTSLRYAIIASIIAQHGIKLTKFSSNQNEYLSVNGKIISIWNNTMSISFDIEE